MPETSGGKITNLKQQCLWISIVQGLKQIKATSSVNTTKLNEILELILMDKVKKNL